MPARWRTISRVPLLGSDFSGTVIERSWAPRLVSTARTRPAWRVTRSSAAAATGTGAGAWVTTGWLGLPGADAPGTAGAAPGAGTALGAAAGGGSGGLGLAGGKTVYQMAMTASESTKARSRRRVSTEVRALFRRMFYGQDHPPRRYGRSTPPG